MTADLVVIVRYSDCVRRAVIRRSRYKPSTRRRTKSGRPYAEVWHIVKWLDNTEADYELFLRHRAGVSADSGVVAAGNEMESTS